jgi:subtilisin family serine protease
MASVFSGAAAAVPDVWANLSAETLAGRLDPALADSLRSGGLIDVLIVYDDTVVNSSVEAGKAARGALIDDAAAIADKTRQYSALKTNVRTQAVPGVSELRDYPSLGAHFVRFSNPDALLRALRAPGVRAVRANQQHSFELAESLPLINQPAAQLAGYSGAGTSVAVLDTGLNYLHASFGCIAPATPLATCKVAYVQDFAPDDGSLDANGHGTNVAAIVAGVAPGSRVIGLDVFNGGSAWSSDILAAIQWTISNRPTYNIVAVNMSLGASGSYNVNQCAGSWAATAFTNLRAAGILPVVAAGNHGFLNGSFSNGISSPACTPGALAVGAVYDSAPGVTYNWGSAPNQCSDSGITANKITCFSQSASYLGLLAPGALISAGGYVMGGTSQATPHVAGAVAVVSAANPVSTVAVRECALTSTGPAILDIRNGVTKNRLDVLAAAQSAVSNCGANNPAPMANAIAPMAATAGGAGFNLTVNGGSFVPGSVVRWNGADRTTTFVTAGQLTSTITAGDISSPGGASVSVFNPAPGGGNSGSIPFTINAGSNPAPSAVTLSPNTFAANAPGFALTVSGANFVNGAVVRWAGTDRTTTFINSTLLSGAILASDTLAEGIFPVTVFNPAPGGGTSNALSFTVTAANNPPPILDSIAPFDIAAGSPAFVLTLSGSGFVASSTVNWNGSARPTTFLSPTRLEAAISAADVSAVSTLPVTVFTPGPGGGPSNPSFFAVVIADNPVPVATSISPTTMPVGSPQFTLTLHGSNFVNGATVRWNGNDRSTTFVNSSQVTAIINASDIAYAAVNTVTVFNPPPVGGLTNAQSFTVANPTPSISNLAPTWKRAGSAAFTLTISGSGFIPSSLVRWNGANRITTFVGSGQLTASIGAADLATIGTAAVTVSNPAPGGGISPDATFTIKKRTRIQGLVSVNGVPATDGYVVTVNVEGTSCGAATTTSGHYNIEVDCDAGHATVGAGNEPNRSFALDDESEYELDIAVTNQFDAIAGTRVQTWTGSHVPMEDFPGALPTAMGALFEWDDSSQQFRFWFRGFPTAFQTLTGGLAPGRTYFIQASGAATVNVPGGSAFVLPSGSEVSFASGVNGVLWGGANVPAPQLGTALPPEIAAVFCWNIVNQGFDFWFRGFPAGFQTLNGGLHAWRYYFLQATAPGTFLASIR